jgi:hypothetical protein
MINPMQHAAHTIAMSFRQYYLAHEKYFQRPAALACPSPHQTPSPGRGVTQTNDVAPATHVIRPPPSTRPIGTEKVSTLSRDAGRELNLKQ